MKVVNLPSGKTVIGFDSRELRVMHDGAGVMFTIQMGEEEAEFLFTSLTSAVKIETHFNGLDPDTPHDGSPEYKH